MTIGSFVVAAVVLTDEHGRIVLVRKRGTSRFMLPGGKIEPGEEPEACAIREAAEELGVTLDPERLALLGVWEAPAANEPDHRVRGHIYLHPWVAGTGEGGELCPSGEIDAILRLHPDEAGGRNDLAPLFEFRVLPALIDPEVVG
jgi:8-oxo-dGTP diphosphatase